MWNKYNKQLFLWGLPFILGEVWCDISIDAYLYGEPHGFGSWLDKKFKINDPEFIDLTKGNRESKVKELYREYVNHRREWDDLPALDKESFDTYLSDRQHKMDLRWADEKKSIYDKAEGTHDEKYQASGYGLMDWMTHNPEEGKKLLRLDEARIGPTISAEESMERIQKIIEERNNERR